MNQALQEIQSGERFAFGKNWRQYLAVLDEDRIGRAEQSLRGLLDCGSLSNKTFLDVGSGSGLFSLAAKRCGALVHSFDYDPQSVACTRDLKQRYSPSDKLWTVEEGSILDLDFVKSLPCCDIVYSWGVLHHTGAMWQALEYVTLPVKPGGTLCIALYNDQGFTSKIWIAVKRIYCSGRVGQLATLAIFLPYFIVAGFVFDVLKWTNPLKRYREYRKQRGMSVVRDWLDWLGGYPFEVARPRDVVAFYERRGFRLKTLRECCSNGNNEYVFERGT